MSFTSSFSICEISSFLIRFEEKLANLESENKVLRKQAVSMPPNKLLPGRSKSTLQVNVINFQYCVFERHLLYFMLNPMFLLVARGALKMVILLMARLGQLQ